MLALQLAYRFLKEGRTQTLLILAGVTIGVAAYVFITATMVGVGENMVSKTLGSQAHISVFDETQPPQPLITADGRSMLRIVVNPEPSQKPFDQWQRALTRVEATPGVTSACPTLSGTALALRGGGQQAIRIVGADPYRLRRVIDIPSNMVEGEFRPDADQVVIGSILAEELGLGIGRPMRIRTTSGEASVRVVGIFELGAAGVDGQWVVTSLRTAQSLLGRPGDITAIDVTVEELYEAEAIATRVAARTGLTAESWMERNGALLTALDAQSQSTILIRVFTLLSVAMGIASVLAVTVVQRRGQIGILRAMGVRARVILMTFLWQGALLGIAGAFLGTGVGMLAGKGLATVVPFDIVVDASTAGQALAISLTTGILAALWPAASAARMDPSAAIRGDG